MFWIRLVRRSIRRWLVTRSPEFQDVLKKLAMAERALVEIRREVTRLEMFHAAVQDLVERS